MKVSNPVPPDCSIPRFALIAAFFLMSLGGLNAAEPSAEGAGQWKPDRSRPASVCEPPHLGSPYIPVDSWVYPAVLRLYSMGFVDTVFLGMRPWTRSSLEHMLEETGARIDDADAGPSADQAQDIYGALMHLLYADANGPCMVHQGKLHLESAYSVARAIGGTPLRDSYHLGSTIVNDYGRPYENGFSSYSGASGYASAGRFLIYVRGEFQAVPSAAGYSAALAQRLVGMDNTAYYFNNSGSTGILIPLSQQATVPAGPLAAVTTGRVMEAYLSYQYFNHAISLGKQDAWMGPGMGGGMAYSNNAENIYSFRINRIEPLYIPLLSRLTGPFRYDFLIGPLKGHSYPVSPWVHVEKISLRPTKDLELGFERTVIWGGQGHEPVNIKSFLRSFFSATAGAAQKFTTEDPGARFSAADFSYRLPYIANWVTLYAEGEVHDDVSPVDAPRRAAWRPGAYLSHFPGVAKLDLRVEGATTAPPVNASDPTHKTAGYAQAGHFMYYEGVQADGYTNAGQIFGDWIGREAKGGQVWLTLHLSGNEWVQASYRRQKATADFIPGGTTLNDVNFQVVKRIGKDLEINGSFAYERWKAPICLPGEQTVTTTTIQVTWFPERKVSF